MDFAEPVADAEVEVGIERRHDLAGVGLDDLDSHFDRHVVGRGVLPGRLLHLVVIDEPIDQRAPAGLLERPDLDLQAGADLVEDLVGAAAEKPAGTRNEQAVEQREGREHSDQERQPQRHRNGRRHDALPGCAVEQTDRRGAGDDTATGAWVTRCGSRRVRAKVRARYARTCAPES